MVRVGRPSSQRRMDIVKRAARGPAGYFKDGYVGCPRSPIEAVGRQIGEVNLWFVLSRVLLLMRLLPRENKDLKTRQARMAVETAKEVANDKTLRNKAEKERRLREKNQNNTKKFIEERKITAMKQGKEKEKLVAMHAKQLEDLNRDIQLVLTRFFSFYLHKHIFF